jgi:hypothetical protein
MYGIEEEGFEAGERVLAQVQKDGRLVYGVFDGYVGGDRYPYKLRGGTDAYKCYKVPDGGDSCCELELAVEDVLGGDEEEWIGRLKELGLIPEKCLCEKEDDRE